MSLLDPITSEAERYRRLITSSGVGVTPEQIEEERRKKVRGLLPVAAEESDDFEAPVDPGKDFGEYMASQGGVSGFFGSALKPKLAKLIFRDDLKDFRQAQAGYATEKALFDIEQAGREQEAKNSAGDAQNEAASDYIRAVRDGEAEWDPMTWAALAGEAGGYSAFNPNGYTLGQGQQRRDAFGNLVASGGPEDNRSNAEKQFDRWLTENPNATKEQRQTAYNTILRAGFSANGVRFDSITGEEIGGDTDGKYAEIQSAASEGGSQGQQHVFDSFESERNRYISAWDEHDRFDERIARFDTALELFDPNRPGGAVDTGPLAGRIYSMFGIGDEGIATIANLGTRETIDMLSNFKGTTTDFEFSASELASFASIMKGEVSNKETLEVARNALARQAKRNADAAEAAYKSMGDYAGDNGILKNSYETTTGNYKPWWDKSGGAGSNSEGIIDGVPTFERFTKDAKERGMTDPAEIRALYNQHYPTPRK